MIDGAEIDADTLKMLSADITLDVNALPQTALHEAMHGFLKFLSTSAINGDDGANSLLESLKAVFPATSKDEVVDEETLADSWRDFVTARMMKSGKTVVDMKTFDAIDKLINWITDLLGISDKLNALDVKIAKVQTAQDALFNSVITGDFTAVPGMDPKAEAEKAEETDTSTDVDWERRFSFVTQDVTPAEDAAYKEVYDRYHNADGSAKPGWMKAPNGKPTKLTEQQWVIVRTPSFKKWFGDWEKSELLGFLENGSVASAVGDEYKGEKIDDIEDAVEKVFEKFGGKVENAELGTVKLTRNGIHDSVMKGVGRKKLAIFNSLPEIIRDGRVVKNDDNWKGRGYNTSVIVAPVTIGGEKDIAVVVVRKYGNKDNNFYLHEVELLEQFKNRAGGLRSGLPNNGQVGPSSGLLDSIAQIVYGSQIGPVSKVVDENGEPRVVYHGTRNFGFTIFDLSKMDDGISIFTSSSIGIANTYSYGNGKVRRIGEKIDRTSYKKHERDLRDAIGTIGERLSDAESDRSMSRLHEAHEIYNNFKEEWIDNVNGVSRLKDELIKLIDNNESADDELKSKLREYADEAESYAIAFADSIIDADTDESSGNYALFVNSKNPYIVNGKGSSWNRISDDNISQDDLKTRDVASYAKEHGHDGVFFRDIRDNGWGGRESAGDVFVAFSPTQIKSADPVTYDDAGNVIPLSNRFNATNPDIRYSLKSLGVPYQGSKGQIAEDIVGILPRGKRFVDLFSGGGAMTHAAMRSGKYGSYRMNDLDGRGQDLFLGAMNGEYKDYATERTSADWDSIKNTPEGILRSRMGNGRQFNADKDTTDRNIRRVNRVADELAGRRGEIEDSKIDYRDVELKDGDVVYADIPYAGTDTTAYNRTGKFDHAAFNDWAQSQNVPVYVSSYTMPAGWTQVYETQAQGIKGMKTERLFVQDKFADIVKASIEQGKDIASGTQKSANTAYPGASEEVREMGSVALSLTVDPAVASLDNSNNALKELSGKALHNDSTGIDAFINSVQRRKMVSNAAIRKSVMNGFSIAEHNAAVSIIDKIWKHAELASTQPDKSGAVGVTISRFVSMVRLGDRYPYAYLTAKSTVENGTRVYSVELEKLEMLEGKLKDLGLSSSSIENIVSKLRDKFNGNSTSRYSFASDAKALIAKKRPDLYTEERVNKIIAEARPIDEKNGVFLADSNYRAGILGNNKTIDKTVDEILKFPDSKTRKAALHWFIKGAISLPEDAPKITEALKYGERAKGKANTDALSYASPMAMIESLHQFKPKAKPINPDKVPQLSDKREMGYGVVTYLVQDDRAGQQAMRKIINTHWGEDANPWCLLHGDGYGNLSDGTNSGYDAWHYWNHYNALPKRVAFKDGKLLAFMATDADVGEAYDLYEIDESHFPEYADEFAESGEDVFGEWMDANHHQELVEYFGIDSSSATEQWWDRQDSSHEGIPLGNIPVPGDAFGRWADFEIRNGEMEQVGRMHKGDNRGENGYAEWYTNGSLSCVNEDGYFYQWFEDGTLESIHENGTQFTLVMGEDSDIFRLFDTSYEIYYDEDGMAHLNGMEEVRANEYEIDHFHSMMNRLSEVERIYRENSQTGRGTRFSIGMRETLDPSAWGDLNREVKVVGEGHHAFIIPNNGNVRDIARSIYDAAIENVKSQANYEYDPVFNRHFLLIDGKKFQVTRKGIDHSNDRRIRKNADAASLIGDILNASIEIPNIAGPWHYRIAKADFGNNEFVLITSHDQGGRENITDIEILHSVNTKTGTPSRTLTSTGDSRLSGNIVSDLRDVWQGVFLPGHFTALRHNKRHPPQKIHLKKWCAFVK